MTSIQEQRSLARVAFMSAAESYVQKIIVLGTSSRISYELWNVNRIRWWYWKISTDETEVDYWKSEVIAFIVVVCFLISLRCRIQGEGQRKKHFFSIGSILIFKLIWIDAMSKITESRIVHWRNFIKIAEGGIKKKGILFYFYFLEALEGIMSHKHVETNRRVAEHNSYPLEYQSYVEKKKKRLPTMSNMLSIINDDFIFSPFE